MLVAYLQENTKRKSKQRATRARAEEHLDRQSEEGVREVPAIVAGQIEKKESVRTRRREGLRGKPESSLDARGRSLVTERQEGEMIARKDTKGKGRMEEEEEEEPVIRGGPAESTRMDEANDLESQLGDGAEEVGQPNGKRQPVESQQVEPDERMEAEEMRTKVKGGPSYWEVMRDDLLYCILASLALAGCVVAWSLLIPYGDTSNRYIWISCLFAPFG